MTTVFDDWRHRHSQLCKLQGRWHVITGWTHYCGTDWPQIRPLRRWSPRDWIRIPLHHWWERRYW